MASLIYIASFRQQGIHGKTWGKGEREREGEMGRKREREYISHWINLLFRLSTFKFRSFNWFIEDV